MSLAQVYDIAKAAKSRSDRSESAEDLTGQEGTSSLSRWETKVVLSLPGQATLHPAAIDWLEELLQDRCGVMNVQPDRVDFVCTVNGLTKVDADEDTFESLLPSVLSTLGLPKEAIESCEVRAFKSLEEQIREVEADLPPGDIVYLPTDLHDGS